jgi:hypothetical protein
MLAQGTRTVLRSSLVNKYLSSVASKNVIARTSGVLLKERRAASNSMTYTQQVLHDFNQSGHTYDNEKLSSSLLQVVKEGVLSSEMDRANVRRLIYSCFDHIDSFESKHITSLVYGALSTGVGFNKYQWEHMHFLMASIIDSFSVEDLSIISLVCASFSDRDIIALKHAVDTEITKRENISKHDVAKHIRDIFAEVKEKGSCDGTQLRQAVKTCLHALQNYFPADVSNLIYIALRAGVEINPTQMNSLSLYISNLNIKELDFKTISQLCWICSFSITKDAANLNTLAALEESALNKYSEAFDFVDLCCLAEAYSYKKDSKVFLIIEKELLLRDFSNANVQIIVEIMKSFEMVDRYNTATFEKICKRLMQFSSLREAVGEQITMELKNAKSKEAIFSIFGRKMHLLNSQHLSTCISMLSKDDTTVIETVNGDNLQSIIHHCFMCIDDFNAEEISNLIRGVSKMQIKFTHEQYKLLNLRLTSLASEFSASSIANILSSYQAYGDAEYCDEVFSIFEKELMSYREITFFSLRTLGFIARSFIKSGRSDSKVVQIVEREILNRSFKDLDVLTIKELHTTFTLDNFNAPKILEKIKGEMILRRGSSPAPKIAPKQFAAGIGNVNSLDELFTLVYKERHVYGHLEYLAAVIRMSVIGPVKNDLHRAKGRELIGYCFTYSHTLNPREITSLIWSGVKSGIGFDDKQWQVVDQLVCREVENLKLMDFSDTLWAFTTGKRFEAQVYDTIATKLIQTPNLEGASPSCVCYLYWSYACRGKHLSSLFNLLDQYVLPSLSKITDRNLTLLLSGFSSLERKDLKKCNIINCILKELQGRDLTRYKMVDLIVLRTALVKMNFKKLPIYSRVNDLVR